MWKIFGTTSTHHKSIKAMFFGALNLKVPSEENVTFRFSLRRLSKDGYLTSENLDLFHFSASDV